MIRHIPGPTLLARYLALGYVVVIIYASLHPFTGWRDLGISPFAFVEEGWPRYWTLFDVITNVLAYLPLGTFLSIALHPLRRYCATPLLAIFLGLCLSFGLETIQTWLPSRVPSSLDLVCNVLGTALGTWLGHSIGLRFLGRLAYWHHRFIAPIPHADLGLTLLALWLFIPLSPEISLFGVGDIRRFFLPSELEPFDAEIFRFSETRFVLFNVLSTGLLARTLIAGKWLPFIVVPLLVVASLAMRTFGELFLINADAMFNWATSGALMGLMIGLPTLMVCMFLPLRARLFVAIFALFMGMFIINSSPMNPYTQAALATWKQGYFLNFNGLTRLAATLWPFLTLPYLVLIARRSNAILAQDQ